jgi:O-antigen/teichoic acid export membrane protein
MTNSLTLKFRQIRSFASFSSFDTSTEEGRSNERHRRIFLTAVASALAKVVSMATMLVSIPLTLHYLGTERFGLWMTISSVIAMLGFADLGIGNGLLNAISEAIGKDDHAAIRRYISSAFVILSGITLVILLAFSLIYSFVPWAHFFNVKSPLAMQESGVAVAVFMLCFALNIPAGIVQRTQMGLQMGFVANLWQMVGSVLGLIAVLLVIHFELGLPWLVGAMAGVPVLVASLNGMLFFGRVRFDIRPDWTLVCREAMKKIARTGFLFLVLQIAVSIAFASDNIVISRVLGAEAVTQYAVPEKLFSIIPILLGMILMPLWPAYGEAMARGDGSWIKKIFVRSLKISITVSSVLALALGVFANDILSIWIGHHVSPPFLLLLGMGIWKIFEGWGIAVAVFLNGANIVRLQASLAILMAVIAVILKIVLTESMGVAGVVWATIIAYGIVTFAPLSFVIPKLLKQLECKK